MGDQGDVSWVGLILSLSLIVIAIGVSLRERLGLERDMIVSVARCGSRSPRRSRTRRRWASSSCPAR